MTGVRQSEKVLTRVLLVLIFGSSLSAPKALAQLAACGSPAVQPCINKYVDPLPIPSVFVTTTITVNSKPADYYEIAARQVKQQALSSGTVDTSGHQLMTTMWGYGQNNVVNGIAGPYDPTAPTSPCTLGTVSPPGTTTFQNCFSSPAPTIFANTGRLVEVKWINDLLCHTGDAGCTPGSFLTYTSGVKPTFDNHWANPQRLCGNGAIATDCKGSGFYNGPVPLIVHAHGETSASESDGLPEAWNLPASGFDTSKYFPYGSDYCQVDPSTFHSTTAPQRDPRCNTGVLPASYRGDGAARFTYPNRQFATTLFFHDHALGVTTENVYMGLAGFYLLTGTNTNVSGLTSFNFSHDLPSDCGSLTTCADGSTSVTGGLPQGDCTLAGFGVDPVTGATSIDPQTQASGCFELGLAIADKAFNTDGSLKFSESGNVILVNGKTWPFLNVEPRKYRFRIVVAAPTSRFDLMFPSTNDNATGGPTVTLTQIGADGGLLPHPSPPLTKLSLMPGERADVIVDFSNFWSCAQPFGSGCSVKLLNGNGGRGTGEVMQFNIVPFAGCDPNYPATCFPPTADTSCNPSVVDCTNTHTTFPHRSSEPVTATPSTRQVSLFDDHLGNCSNPGCVSSTPLPWDGNVTENPTAGKTEIWEMYDFQDAHPMHLHEAQFEVINRENMSTHVVYNCVGTAKNAIGQTVNCASPPVPGETGFKDTVTANGGTITRVRATFAGPAGPQSDPAPEQHPGLFAWHCHINPHEDNEMMRPMCVLRQGQSATNVSAENFCQ
jgi:spore coat protein A